MPRIATLATDAIDHRQRSDAPRVFETFDDRAWRIRHRAEVSADRATRAGARRLSRDRGRRRWRTSSRSTLDAMGWGGLCTTTSMAGSSAARRRATGRSRARRRLLDVNASLLRMYVEAPRRSGSRAIASAPTTSCATCRRGWPIQSTAAGPARSRPTPRYYARPPRSAGACTAPAVDAVLYAALECADGLGHASRRRAPRRHGARRVRAEVARAPGRRLLQRPAPGSRTASTEARRSAGCSTTRSRWPPRTSTLTRPPATSSTR